MNQENELALYWEQRYKSVVQQNAKLRDENRRLQQELQEVLDGATEERSTITLLSQTIDSLRKELEMEKSLRRQESQKGSLGQGDILHLDDFSKTLCGSGMLLNNSILKAANRLTNQDTYFQNLSPEHLQDSPQIKSTRISSPPTLHTNDLLEEFYGEHMFEEYMVIGINEDKDLQIMFQFPGHNIPQDSSIYRVIPDFTFPKGHQVRKILLSDSASEMHQFIYGQSSFLRDHNIFIYTLNPQDDTRGPLPDPTLPNYNKKLLYCICLVLEDVMEQESFEEGAQYITSKAHCLLSYYPCFDLHFQVLSRLIAIKRLNRMSYIANSIAVSPYSKDSLKSILSQSDRISEEELRLLQNYYHQQIQEPRHQIHIQLQEVDAIFYTAPKQL